MTTFVGTYQAKLDRKGRVSVPSAIRGVLARIGDMQLYLRPSHRWPCLEAWPREAFEKMAGGINHFPEFSDERDDLSLSIFGDTYEAAPDGEGRMMLPQDLSDIAKLGETVSFVGNGAHFQIWDKDALDRRKEEARLRAASRNITMPSRAEGARPSHAEGARPSRGEGA